MYDSSFAVLRIPITPTGLRPKGDGVAGLCSAASSPYTDGPPGDETDRARDAGAETGKAKLPSFSKRRFLRRFGLGMIPHDMTERTDQREANEVFIASKASPPSPASRQDQTRPEPSS